MIINAADRSNRAIEITIKTLLADAKPIDNPIVKMLREEAQVNATRGYLECQVVLNSGYSIAGVLCSHDVDTLRMVAVAQTPDKKILLADHYFTYGDVETIVIGREMPEQLVKPSRGGSPIIMGH